ncbi:MAG: polysaccharide biosynthesis protein, partial [Actinomycetota bacterium]
MPLFSAPPIAALLMLLGCGGIRFQARLFALERQRNDEKDRLRTLIVGATDEGLALALEVGRRAYTDGVIVGFVDAQQTLNGRSRAGTRVLGTPDDLERICARERIERILIALPDAPRDRVREIVNRAVATEAQVKLLPTEVSEGGSLLGSLRDLDLTDLLGREHAPVATTDLAHYGTGAVVLITGAGGSIGSEIARQVRAFGPERLLVLDRDESLLFDTVSEIPDAVPLLADITDEKRLREIFAEYRPDVVFHAAAHKHVPILESHAAEAVRNNVLATLSLAREAARHRCRLVHISTDKAADPCSVMGATTRAAELVVLAVGTEHGLPVAAVRFGNVLGSRGSVVPT